MLAKAFLLLIISMAYRVLSQRQPRNITRADGESDVFIPCPFEFRPAPSTWRIDERDYTTATTPSIFSITPSGLFINTVHVCLNQTSFQCVDASNNALEEQVSDIGILTVISENRCTAEDLQLLKSGPPQLVLDHQLTRYGSITTTFTWKIVPDSVRVNCLTSRVMTFRECQQNNVELDFTTDNETTTLPSARLHSAGELVDIAISSLGVSQLESCPSLVNDVRINVTETEIVNLLLGNNNCTCVDVERQGPLGFVLTNPEPDQVDIVCRVNADGCYSPEKCNNFLNSQFVPFFRVCNTTTYTFCFGNISDILSGLKLELFAPKRIICGSGSIPYYVTREYFRSFELNVSKALANVSVNTTSRHICFSSSNFNNCNLISVTQYNVSIIDMFGNVVFKATNIPESTCQTVNQLDFLPQCGPFRMSIQPFNDYIMYDSVVPQIITSDNQLPGDEPDLCTCLQASTQLTLTAMYNSQDASVEISGRCSSMYTTPVNITIIDTSSGNGSQVLICSNGRFQYSISSDGCDYEVKLCGYFMVTNMSTLTDCLLSCSRIFIPCSSVPTTSPGPSPGPSPIVIGIIAATIIIIIIIIIVIAIIIWSVVRSRRRSGRSARGNNQQNSQGNDATNDVNNKINADDVIIDLENHK